MLFSRNLGIFPRLFVTLLAVSLIPLAGIWFISHQTSIALTEQKVDQ